MLLRDRGYIYIYIYIQGPSVSLDSGLGVHPGRGVLEDKDCLYKQTMYHDRRTQ